MFRKGEKAKPVSNSSSKDDLVGSMQYDLKVKRKSIEDPTRHHRRSSIPFIDRTPAVRFIRSVEAKKASVSGPNDPRGGDNPNKPILKKTNFPILVDVAELNATSSGSNISTTNDELEMCRVKAEVVMDRISKSERVARGSMDILTFPSSTRRTDALSRYQGCLTVCVCTIAIHLRHPEFKVRGKAKKPSFGHSRTPVELAYEMQLEAGILHTTAKNYLSLARVRYGDYDELLRRNTEFRMEQTRLSYPIYTQKRMPESVTLYEDAVEADSERDSERDSDDFDGTLRISRKYETGLIYLSRHVETETGLDRSEPVNFQECSLDRQTELIKAVISHGKDLLFYCNNSLAQALEVLHDPEIDDTFSMIQRKISGLEYDYCYDPLCALELKNSLGELVARKAELLNTAEQIMEHCKWIASFTKAFYRYTRKSFTGKSGCCCWSAPTKKKLISMLGIVAVDDVTIVLPLPKNLAAEIFQQTPLQATDSDSSISNRVDLPGNHANK